MPAHIRDHIISVSHSRVPTVICPRAYMRSTLTVVPNTAELLRSTALPFGTIVTPFREAAPGEPPLPVIPFGPGSIIRCTHCRNYLNPFVHFASERSWICNICNFLNDSSMFA